VKFFSKTVSVTTRKPFDFVVIDNEANRIVAESKIKNGFVLLRSPHNTATVICNENDRTVLGDIEKVLKKLLPKDFPWAHNYEGLNNARAHQAVSLLGHTHWVPIESGRLKLGTWQSIFLLELFEGRRRRVEVVVVGE
jgi:secondary thiamine-phosphate synthase enzyme